METARVLSIMARNKKQVIDSAKQLEKYSKRTEKVYNHFKDLHEERNQILNSTSNEDTLRKRITKNMHREMILAKLLYRDITKEDASAHNLKSQLLHEKTPEIARRQFTYLFHVLEHVNEHMKFLMAKWSHYKEAEGKPVKEMLDIIEKYHHEEAQLLDKLDNAIDYDHLNYLEKKIHRAKQILKKKPALHIPLGAGIGFIAGFLLSLAFDPSMQAHSTGQEEAISHVDMAQVGAIFSALGAAIGTIKTIRILRAKEHDLESQEEDEVKHKQLH